MIVSEKEKALLVVTVVFMLYAAVALTLRKHLDAVREMRATQGERARLLAEYRGVIAQKQQWEDAYASKAGLMPVFEPGRQVETYWLGVLDRVASKNHLSIIRRQAGEERLVGDVYEMPIDCKEWEGDLDALVSFLYDIHAEGAMLDVRRLFVRPAGNKSAGLRGSFTLTCAYMRSETASEPDKEPNMESGKESKQ